MYKQKVLIGFFFLWGLLSVVVLAAEPQLMAGEKGADVSAVPVGAKICRLLEEEVLNKETLNGDDLRRFYIQAQCLPAWSNERGVDSQALYLIHAIRLSSDDGLEYNDPAYNLENILSLLSTIKSNGVNKQNTAVLARLDILLTDAYMTLGKHLNSGVLPREDAPEYWTVSEKQIDMVEHLQEALLKGTVTESLDQLSPDHPSYLKLKGLLRRYLQIRENGGWKRIESFTTDPHEVELYFAGELKERLRVEGDLSVDDDSTEGFHTAVISFQTRHGIKPDGKVGSVTLSKLNMTVDEKIAAIRLNLERWRWVPKKRERSYIEVNIPDFRLGVVSEDQPLFGMKAIVGKPTRPTPIFDAWMAYIVVNPYWRVPETILREDIIPKVRRNIGYLKKERIRIFRNSDEKGVRAISPLSIDWNRADPATFPYYLRQDAGKKNVLGQLKFMFPNPHDIYIHDTPDKYLFDRETRSYSSGCIRIEEPAAFADYLLKNDDKSVALAEPMTSRANKNIFLSKRLKVYISYWTVWEDDEGKAHFRDDVYGYDRDLAAMLGWQYGTF